MSLTEPHAPVACPQGCRSELVPAPPPLGVDLGVTDVAHSPAVAEALLKGGTTQQPLRHTVHMTQKHLSNGRGNIAADPPQSWQKDTRRSVKHMAKIKTIPQPRVPSNSFVQIHAPHNNTVSTELHLHQYPKHNNLLLGSSRTIQEPRVTLTDGVQSYRGWHLGPSTPPHREPQTRSRVPPEPSSWEPKETGLEKCDNMSAKSLLKAGLKSGLLAQG